MENMKNPWKGLDFYRESEILYGRDVEIESLYDYISHNSQVVLYGRSGIGKSSIINAGVFPKARRDGMLPVAIKLAHDNSSSYVQQLKDVIRQNSIDAYEVVPALREDESLWEFFHRHQFFDGEGKRVRLLVVLDQFEEIFTLQNDESIRHSFFSELADLFNDTIPEYIVEARKVVSEKLKKADTLAMEVTENELNIDIDLNLEVYEKKEDTKDYLANSSVHIVFVIREDFLSYLERYSVHIPVMRNNRFPLLPLNEEQATDIILKPCPGLVDKKVAKLIIDAVTQQQDYNIGDEPEIEVDAAVLSLFLSELFAKKAVEDDHITAEMVTTLGQNIISEFYEKSVADLSLDQVDLLESELLTTNGRRDNRSKSDLVAIGLSTEQINQLIVEKKILRQFQYEGDLRVEFIHDILCPVIIDRKARREQIRQEQQLKAKEEATRQEERNWRISGWIAILVSTVGIAAIFFFNAKRVELNQKQERISQMEQSLIVQASKHMLNTRDVYGSMQLLLNVIDTTQFASVDAQTASLECLLRQSLDSLNNSYLKPIAKRSIRTKSITRDFKKQFTISRDGKWISFQSEEGDLHICDAKTLNDVYKFKAEYPAQLTVCDYSIVHTDSEKGNFVDCLVVQDDSVLLVCRFNPRPISTNEDEQGVIMTYGNIDKHVMHANFLQQDSLILVVYSKGLDVIKADMSSSYPWQSKDISIVFSLPQLERGTCVDFALSPDRSHLFVQSGEYVYLFDTFSWEEIWKYRIGNIVIDNSDGQIYFMACYPEFSHDGKYIFCENYGNGTIQNHIINFDNNETDIYCFSVHNSDPQRPFFIEMHCDMDDFIGYSSLQNCYYYLKENDDESTDIVCTHISTGSNEIVAQKLPGWWHNNTFLTLEESKVLLLNNERKLYCLNMEENSCYYQGELDIAEFYPNATFLFDNLIYRLDESLSIIPLTIAKKETNVSICENTIWDTIPRREDNQMKSLLKSWGYSEEIYNDGYNVISPDSSKIIIDNFRRGRIEGRYVHNGVICMSYSSFGINEILSSRDGRYLYVKPFNPEPYIIDLLPLPKLVDSCRKILGPSWKAQNKEDLYYFGKF